MRLIPTRTTSFRGGMVDNAATADDFEPETCALMLNARPDRDGGAKPREGSFLLGDTGLSGDVTAAVFVTAAGAEQIVVGCGADLKYSADGGATWSSCGLAAAGERWQFATMRVGATNYLLAVNGVNAKKWDGAALSDMAGVPGAARYVAVVNNRAWVADGLSNRVYACKIDNPDVWATPDGLSVPVGDASPLAGLAAAPEGDLFAFKRTSVARVDGFGESSLVVGAGARGLSASLGTVDAFTYTPAGNRGACWMSERGLEYYVGGELQEVGAGVEGHLSGYDMGALAGCGFYLADRDEVWLLGGRIDGSDPDGVAVNLTTGAAWRMAWAQARVRPLWFVSALCTDPGTSLTRRRTLGFTSTGDVLAFDGAYAEDGAGQAAGPVAIAARVDTALYGFGAPLRRKRARLVRVLATSANQESTATVTCIADGVAGRAHVLTIPQSADGLRPRVVLARVNGRGANIQVRVEFSGVAKLAAVEVEAELLHGIH